MVHDPPDTLTFESFFVAEFPRLVSTLTASPDVASGDGELWAAVRRLPDRQRAAIVLHYVDDLGLADIAGVLECSIGTVKTISSADADTWPASSTRRSRHERPRHRTATPRRRPGTS